MSSQMERDRLHLFFFPFVSQGHVIPTMEIAKLFASPGSKATIVTTSHFAQLYSKAVEEQSRVLGDQIEILVIRIPCSEVGLPEGFEFHMASSHETHLKLFQAIRMLGPQLDELLQRHRPDCLVADTFFPWATDVASLSGIPTLVFHAMGYFGLCASLCVFLYEPYKNVSSDSEPFVIPTLPDQIKFTKDKLPADFLSEEAETEFARLYKETRQVELRSFGVLVNSFYELEPAYADHYKKVLGIKAWQIGPHCIYNKTENMKILERSVNEHECLKWLDSKEPDTVVYVCFGSMVNFSDAQLLEIAAGLESSGLQFIWVVKGGKVRDGVREEWLPQGFEKRMEDRGLIIRGWAPQVLILEHDAIGGFLSHSGWNSTLEAVCAGKPMATWPVFADHFYNEKLVTQLLGMGVSVGAQKWASIVGDNVKGDAIEKAVRRVMEGEEAEEMRSRAKALAKMARRAVEEGGSSYSDFNALLEELKLNRSATHDSN